MSRNLILAFLDKMTPVLMELLQLGVGKGAQNSCSAFVHKHLTDVKKKTPVELLVCCRDENNAINYK